MEQAIMAGAEPFRMEGNETVFVPHERPRAVAAELERLIRNPSLRRRLGGTLRRKVEREYGVAAVARRWEALFDEVVAEANAPSAVGPEPGHGG